MERLMRLREPAAVVALVALGPPAGPHPAVVAMSSGAPVEADRAAPGVLPRRPGPAGAAHRTGRRVLGPRAHPARPRLDPRPRLVLTAALLAASWCWPSSRLTMAPGPKVGIAPLSAPHSCRRSPSPVICLGASDRPAARGRGRPPAGAGAAGRRARTGAGRPAAAAHLDPGRGGRYGMAAGRGRCVTDAVDELGQPRSDRGRVGPHYQPGSAARADTPGRGVVDQPNIRFSLDFAVLTGM